MWTGVIVYLLPSELCIWFYELNSVLQCHGIYPPSSSMSPHRCNLLICSTLYLKSFYLPFKLINQICLNLNLLSFFSYEKQCSFGKDSFLHLRKFCITSFNVLFFFNLEESLLRIPVTFMLHCLCFSSISYIFVIFQFILYI